MKAAMVQAPGVLEVRDVPDPAVGEYDVLCEMLYGATCTGTDQHILHGRFPWPLRYPLILGHESVGRAVRLGRRVRHFKEGDMITRVGAPPDPGGSYDAAWGGFAEYGIARDHRAMREDGQPVEEWTSYRVNQVVPPGIEAKAAPMIITWRETLSYLTRLKMDLSARVLIIGSGGNGLAFAAHARNLGAQTIAMVGSRGRQNAGTAAGATHYFDYRAENLLDIVSEQLGEGIDVLIDAVGKQGLVDTMLPLLRPGGTFGIYGIDDYGRVTIDPARARGTFTFYNGGYDEEESHNAVISFLEKGRLDPAIWLDMNRVFALEQIQEAFEAVVNRAMVKALVRLSE